MEVEFCNIGESTSKKLLDKDLTMIQGQEREKAMKRDSTRKIRDKISQSTNGKKQSKKGRKLYQQYQLYNWNFRTMLESRKMQE